MNHENNVDLLYKQECFEIQGAVFEVYKTIGVGFLESIYHECLSIELKKRQIPFESEVQIEFRYKENKLQQYFKADLICYGKIILELKAVKAIEPIHRAQLINYLKVTGLRLGLLINFHSYPKVNIERLIL